MSLDVTLTRKYHVSYDGGTTLEEKKEDVYLANITHNLGEMAKRAGLYEALWRPYMLKEDYVPIEDYGKELEYEDSVEIRAKDILPVIENGWEYMKLRPEYFKKFDSPNGWGLYDDFLPWIEKYINACKEYPEAIVSVSR